MKKLPLLFLLFAVCFGDDAMPAVVQDLQEAIRSGHVHLVSAKGNGGSSGSAVEATLENATEAERHVDIYLSAPIFLSNSGKGQNMIVTQVLLAGGRYFSDGRRSFITLGPRKKVQVTFLAFCVDFDKDNPSPSDTFSLGSVPPVLEPVLARIRRHLQANLRAEVTVAGQLAVWLAQGRTPQEIREKFQFTVDDETLARSFVQ